MTNQTSSKMRAKPCNLRAVQRPQDHGQRDVQRRQLVEGQVEAGEHVEQRAGDAVGSRPLEREAERKRDEACDRHQLRRQEPLGMRVELRARRAHEERKRIERIDRPVGDDRPCQKRDRAFPFEYGDRHVRAQARRASWRSRRSGRRRGRGKASQPSARFHGRRRRFIAASDVRIERHGEDAPLVDALRRSCGIPRCRRAGRARPACAAASPTRRRDGS